MSGPRRKFIKPEDVPTDMIKFLCFSKQRIGSPTSKKSRDLHILCNCPDCHKDYWIPNTQIRRGVKRTPRCNACAILFRNYNNGSGRFSTVAGYIGLTISHLDQKDQKLAKETSRTKGFILEHRMVMARYLKRPLTPDDQIHHRNGNKTDNRIANLRLVTKQTHHIAPADKIAVSITEIEDCVRQLDNIGIDVAPILEEFLSKLSHIQSS